MQYSKKSGQQQMPQFIWKRIYQPELNGDHPIVIRFTSPGAVCSDPFSYQVVSVRVRESAYYGGSQCALARFLDTSRHQTTSHIYQSNDI